MEIEHKCACGCNEDTLYNVRKKRYNVYLHGHARRGATRSEESCIKQSQSVRNRAALAAEEPPLCACGCGNPVIRSGPTTWNKYIPNHNKIGRPRSAETKAKIGAANSINMKRYHSEHPELAKIKGEQLRSGMTKESEARRKATLRKIYDEMTPVQKEKFSEHSRNLWKTGILSEAHKKATITFLERSAAGEYDFTERNEKISKRISEMYVNGEFDFEGGDRYSTKMKRIFHYRSSYELAYMELLDSNPDVIDWDYEWTHIPYVFNGANKRYIPDFLVLYADKVEFVEVKPIEMRDYGKNVPKREFALKYCEENGYTYVEWSPTGLKGKMTMSTEETPFCACGCGEQVTMHAKKKVWNQFVNGHHRRGVKQTQEHIQNILKKKAHKGAIGEVEIAPLCECGCGEHVSYAKVGRVTTRTWNRYIAGHNKQGEKMPEEIKEKIRNTLNKRYGGNPPEPTTCE